MNGIEIPSFSSSFFEINEDFPSEYTKKAKDEGAFKCLPFMMRLIRTFAIYYFYFGFCCGWSLLSTLYPLLLDVIDDDNLSISFTIRALGGVFGAMLTPFLIDFFVKRFGTINHFLILTILFIALNQFFFPIINNLYLWLMHLFFEAFVFGTLFCGLTIYLNWIWGRPVPWVLHALHSVAGISGTSMKIFIAIIVDIPSLGILWKIRLPYFLQTIILISSVIPFLLFRIEPPQTQPENAMAHTITHSKSHTIETPPEEKKKNLGQLFFSKVLCNEKLYIFFMICVGSHFSIATMLVHSGALNYYLVKELKESVGDAVLKLTAFNFAFMAGRLCVIPLSLYFSSAQILLLCHSFGLWSIYMLWIWSKVSPEVLWIGLIMQGFFCAPTFSPYFTLTVQEFGWKINRFGISMMSYLGILAWFYASVSISFMDSVSNQTFIYSLVFLYSFGIVFNSLMLIFGKSLMCCRRKREITSPNIQSGKDE